MNQTRFDAGGRETFDHVCDVMVQMRDGVHLATDLLLPEVDGPVPVILERTGYGKDTSPIQWTKSPEYFAARGYAVAIQDVRGIHGSEGTYYPFRDDGWGQVQDGYDTVEWLAAQQWCDGKVGMFGGSYAGATQLRAAIAAPPHLRALVVRQAPNNPLVSVRPNGVIQLTGAGGWIVDQARHALLQAERRLRALQELDSESFFRSFPQIHFDDQLEWARDFLSHDTDVEYWKEFDVVPHASRVRVPILHVGSWYDVHRRSTVAMYQACVEQSPAAGEQRLVMGPWIHGSRFHADDGGRHVGEIDMGPQARLDLNALMLRWFDHWLRDEDTTVLEDLPPVCYFMMGEKTWKDADSWPPAGTEWVTHYAAGADLLPDLPATASHRSFIDRRSDPARTIGGDAVLFEWGADRANDRDPGAGASEARKSQRGPRDQRSEEHKGLVFTTPPLSEDLRLTGPVRAVVYASLATESQPDDACLIVRLCEVHGDGRSIDIVDGSCRMAPGGTAVVPTTVDLGDTAIGIPAGNRLRLGVFASNFPRVPLRADAAHPDLKITIHSGPQTPTSVVLPLSRSRLPGLGQTPVL